MNKLVVAASIAAILAFVLTPALRSLAIRRGYLDVPNERSSHVQPTPRTGGLAILGAFAVAAAVGGALATWRTGVLMAGAFALAALALVDDLRPLPNIARLALQVVILGCVVSVLGKAGGVAWPSSPALMVIAWLTALVWLVGLVNVYNFMDGLNGIAGLAAIVTAATLATLALRRGDLDVAVLAVSLAAATAGFLPFNVPSGSIFMGDTGSTVLGLILGALALSGAQPESLPLAQALPFVPFLLDAGITLVRRALRGERFFSTPHRSHFYQRLQQQGWSHVGVATLYAGLTGVSAALSLVFERLSLTQRALAFTALVTAHILIFACIQRRWSRLANQRGAAGATQTGVNP